MLYIILPLATLAARANQLVSDLADGHALGFFGRDRAVHELKAVSRLLTRLRVDSDAGVPDDPKVRRAIADDGTKSEGFGLRIVGSDGVIDLIAGAPSDANQIVWRQGVGDGTFGPDRLVLELTESATQPLIKLMDTLTRFRIKGIGLAIDDFGTGYSSLMQLRQLPFTEVKIDQLFVGLILVPIKSVLVEFSFSSSIIVGALVEGASGRLNPAISIFLCV